jgi:hypothetical protein
VYQLIKLDKTESGGHFKSVVDEKGGSGCQETAIFVCATQYTKKQTNKEK